MERLHACARFTHQNPQAVLFDLLACTFRENETCTKSWLPFCVAFALLFPKGNWPFSGTGKPPPFCGTPYYFYRIACMNPLFSATRKLGARGDKPSEDPNKKIP